MNLFEFRFHRRGDARNAMLLTAALLTLGGVHERGLAEPRMDDAPSIAQFMKIRAPFAPTMARDSTLYMIDWPEGVNQLYKRENAYDLDSPRTQLTSFEDGVSGYSLSPDDEWIVVEAAEGGSEQDDLHLLNTRTERLRTLLSDPDVVYSFQEWLPDSEGFVYTANDENPGLFNIYSYDLETGASRKLYAASQPGYWYVADVARDGRRMLLGRYYSAAIAGMFELDADTSELRQLEVSDDPSFNLVMGYLPDERSALIISDAQRGMRSAYTMNLSSGELKEFDPDLADHEVEFGGVNHERTHAVVRTNEDGYGRLHLYELPNFRKIPIPGPHVGVASPAESRGRTLVWTVNSAVSPSVTYAWEVDSRAMPRPITSVHAAGVDLSSFTEPKLISYRSFDGLKIPAFLYLPPGYEKGEPIPFIAYYHGGPESQSRPTFNANVQYYLSQGFGVIRPNVRGSAGYGREFHQLDNYKNRWDSVRDGVAAVEWLIKKGYTRKGHVASYGGSYGGFMCVATLLEGEDLYGAGVNIVGVVNFETFLEQTKSYRRELRETEYGPLTDREFLRSVSPIHRADEIDVPMLIAHGLNDPRVPVGEAMQLAVALQRRGLEPELLFFPDEGHGFRKLDNRLLFAERTAAFLKKHIGFNNDRGDDS